MSPTNLPANSEGNIAKYVATKKWYWYLLVLLFCGYIFVESLGFNPNTESSIVIKAIYTIQFGVHEIAHIVAAFLPAVLTAAAGSLSELVLVGTILGVTLHRGYYYAAVFSMVWFMLACQSVGIYISDARSQSLQLVGPGDKVTHDWNFILGQLGLLQADSFIGNTIKIIGIFAAICGLLFGAWLLYQMATYRKPEEPAPQTNPVQQYNTNLDTGDALAAAREAELNEDPKKSASQ